MKIRIEIDIPNYPKDRRKPSTIDRIYWCLYAHLDKRVEIKEIPDQQEELDRVRGALREECISWDYGNIDDPAVDSDKKRCKSCKGFPSYKKIGECRRFHDCMPLHLLWEPIDPIETPPESKADLNIKEMNAEDEALMKASLEPMETEDPKDVSLEEVREIFSEKSTGTGYYVALQAEDKVFVGGIGPTQDKDLIKEWKVHGWIISEIMPDGTLQPIPEEEKGTPGPWKVNSITEGYIVISYNTRVANLIPNKEDAQLISKAWLIPEVIKTLQRIMGHYSVYGPTPYSEEAKELLAKLEE